MSKLTTTQRLPSYMQDSSPQERRTYLEKDYLNQLPSEISEQRYNDFVRRQELCKSRDRSINERNRNFREREKEAALDRINFAEIKLSSGNCDYRDVYTLLAMAEGFENVQDYKESVHLKFQDLANAKIRTIKIEARKDEADYLQNLINIATSANDDSENIIDELTPKGAN